MWGRFDGTSKRDNDIMGGEERTNMDAEIDPTAIFYRFRIPFPFICLPVGSTSFLSLPRSNHSSFSVHRSLFIVEVVLAITASMYRFLSSPHLLRVRVVWPIRPCPPCSRLSQSSSPTTTLSNQRLTPPAPCLDLDTVTAPSRPSRYVHHLTLVSKADFIQR